MESISQPPEEAQIGTGNRAARDGPPQPERLESILRRLGLTPDVEYRLRTLELALASVAQDLADEIGHRLDLTQRVQEMEVSLGRLRTRR